jgi:gliding motility-associated protein GldL
MKPGSKRWKQFMAKLYGIGAAVVIIGAMFKIEHWPGASVLLVVGLTTEAIIFFFSAFEPPHEEPDWSLVYPELAHGHGDHSADKKKVGKKGSVTEELDRMLEEAKIEPELIKSLGDGMRNLSTQAHQLTDITGAAAATNEYSTSLKTASEKVSLLTDDYVKASESLAGIRENAHAGNSAGQALQDMNNNLNSLNSMYQLQLQELEKSRDMYTGINDLLGNLRASVEDTRRYKENIADLAENLKALNTIYGNMLNAMGQGNKA